MRSLQLFFVALTIAMPPALWIVSRRLRSDRFDQVVCRVLAILLLGIEIGDLSLKVLGDRTPITGALPMQLCDWALLAVVVALWGRRRTCFEVAYFWALGGTIQALVTPAIGAEVPHWRQAGFFLAHSLIVIGVVFLLLVLRMRPYAGSLMRVIFWSEIYLAAALFANAVTGENYGFLAGKPGNPSLLDLFSDVPWIYVAQINVTGIAFFLALYAPWFLWDRVKSRSAPAIGTTSRI